MLTALLVAIVACAASAASIQPRAAGKTFPVPAFPKQQMYYDPSSYTLSSNFTITNVPTTREYWWAVQAVTGAPDGYPRRMYTINGQFPGPMIEANEGDTIRIHVTNQLDIPTTIHWHGLYQNGTNYMDGVTGFSQCPIPAHGGQFTYEFKIEGQYGTFWYHSHYSNSFTDGFYGAFIVHSPRDPLKLGRDYDQDMVVMVGDWYDVVSEVIVQAIRTNEGFNGYNGAGPFGYADANLINGRGQTNCTNQDISDPSLCNPNTEKFEIQVDSGNTIRMRLINPGTQTMMRVSVDNHTLEVVELDNTPVWAPGGQHEVTVGLGERASIIVKADKGHAGDRFWFRANAQGAIRGQGSNTGLAVFRYTQNGTSASQTLPDTKPWGDLDPAGSRDLDTDAYYAVSPRIPIDAPTYSITTNILHSKGGRFTDINGRSFNGFGFNNISYQAQAGYPLLQQVEERHNIDANLAASVVFPDLGPVDIVVNNMDFFGANVGGINHPFHLHGKGFFLIARGTGIINSVEDLKNVRFNTTNPLRRDTITIPANEYAVMRLVTDIPGVWPIHCHNGLHLSAGKIAAVVIRPDVIRQFAQPQDWKNLCNSFSRDEIDPTLGRRDHSRRSRASRP